MPCLRRNSLKLLSLLSISVIFSNMQLIVGSSTFDPNIMCSLLMNGTKIKDPRACNTWIECIDGQPISGKCAQTDYFYDRSTMECVPAASITCISSNACATTTANLVFVADPYTCNGYYYCTNGVGAHGFCNSGMNFNPGTQDCIRDFKCVAKMDPDSYCNIVPDGIFIKNVENCNGYQLCWDGAVVNQTCPGTFYYNPLTGVCDYPKNVDCVEVVTNPPNAPNPEEACGAENDFIADNNSCNGYYVCRTNAGTGAVELVHATCPAGRFFTSSNGGECVARSQVPCDFDRCVGLGNPVIQLANLPDDDCQGYALCQDGAVIGTGQCPGNEYFDEVTQRCTGTKINYPACMSTKSTSSGDSMEPTIEISTTLPSSTASPSSPASPSSLASPSSTKADVSDSSS